MADGPLTTSKRRSDQWGSANLPPLSVKPNAVRPRGMSALPMSADQVADLNRLAMGIPNTPPPRIVRRFEPFAGKGTMKVFPTGLREIAEGKRRTAAKLLDEAFELEAMARGAELTDG